MAGAGVKPPLGAAARFRRLAREATRLAHARASIGVGDFGQEDVFVFKRDDMARARNPDAQLIVVTLEIAPAAEEPEPKVPADLRKALAAAPPGARKVWSDITPLARRDWIQWIVSAKQAETRARRIRTACDMLAKGKRRPCCFDRSGFYS